MQRGHHHASPLLGSLILQQFQRLFPTIRHSYATEVVYQLLDVVIDKVHHKQTLDSERLLLTLRDPLSTTIANRFPHKPFLHQFLCMMDVYRLLVPWRILECPVHNAQTFTLLPLPSPQDSTPKPSSSVQT